MANLFEQNSGNGIWIAGQRLDVSAGDVERVHEQIQAVLEAGGGWTVVRQRGYVLDVYVGVGTSVVVRSEN